ncbi:uncharacterized protein LOC127135978 [Lathyrus oleraceus]|uniref:uncharacterized protein LOC127135978 n=1 Tax=Pisum sativum TaxID=3888 RepID=UPI0021D102DB|nr:uncharacterized protein LOC127135978 [Pisum sativum]
MDQLEQNQVVMREDMTTVKSQMGQLVEALQALARGQEKMRQANLRVTASNPAIVTILVNPLGGAGTRVVAQPPPERGLVYQNVAQAFNIHVNGRVQPEIDDHQDAFFTTRANSVYDAFGPSLADLERRFCMVEERFKAMEGPDTFGLDAADMCLVSGVKIPPKFKVPSFEKKMVAHSDDEKLLIHFFQDILSGGSLEWYIQLKRTHIRTWGELVEAFLEHYQYNSDMAPNRTQLQSLVQKSDESFIEYAQRWRDLAARVQPPLLERELLDMFMNTLQGPYLDRMIGSTTSGFSDLVINGERIENGLKIGKIQDTTVVASGTKKSHSGFSKKNEGETNATTITKGGDGVYQMPYYPVAVVTPNLYQQPMYAIPTGPPVMQYQQLYAPQQPFTPQQQNYYQQGRQGPRRPPRRFDSVPMPYGILLAHFLKDLLVQLREAKAPPVPLPSGYDMNVSCEYHSGTSGPSIENCNIFKHKV